MDIARHLPLALPARTVRLFREYWVPLLAWCLVGRGLHDLLAEIGARVNYYNTLAGYSLLALGILCSLASYVAMFMCVQRGLPTIWQVRGSQKRTVREVLGGVGLALMPFLLVYSAWNLFEDDLYQLQYRTWQFHALSGGSPDPARFTWQFAIAGAVAWIMVKVCEAVVRRTLNPVAGILAAVFEANWMFFGLFGVMALVGVIKEVAQGTLAWHNFLVAKEFIASVLPVAPIRVNDFVDIASLHLGWLGDYKTALTNGIALPVAWLAIAGCCYGREMEDVRDVVSTGRLSRVGSAWQKAPTPIRRFAGSEALAGTREKYLPSVHAIRMMLTAGLPALLLFCLCYSALDLAKYLLSDVVAAVAGPHSPAFFWGNVDTLVDEITSTMIEPVRICLLAVTFDLALSRFTARTEGTVDSPYSTRSSDEAPMPAS